MVKRILAPISPSKVARVAGFNSQSYNQGVNPGLSLPLTPELWARINKSVEHVAKQERFPVSQYWSDTKSNFCYEYDPGHILISGYQKKKTSIPKSVFSALEKSPKSIINAGLSLAGWRSRDPETHRKMSAWRRGRRHLHLLPKGFQNFFGDWYRIKTAFACSEIMRLSKGSRMVEIGAGGCLLPLALFEHCANLRYYVVDLPIMLPLAVSLVSHVRPDLTLRLPGEATSDFDIGWFVPSEKHLVPAGLDAAISITSFQVMDYDIIADYFAFIDRSLRNGGLIYCVNRKNKSQLDGTSVDFDSYPWPKTGYRTLIDDEDLISSFKSQSAPILRRVLRKT